MHSDTAIMQSMRLYLGQAASLLTAMRVLSSACMLFAPVLTGLQFYSYQSAATNGNNHASMLSMHARLHNHERKSIVTKLSWGWVLHIPCITIMPTMLLVPTGHQPKTLGHHAEL